MNAYIGRHLLIGGRVQGVGYRESMRAVAARLGVTGWVRNRADGRVEAVVQGTPQAVEAIVAWARSGPRGARVDTLAITEVAPAEVAFTSFERRPDA